LSGVAAELAGDHERGALLLPEAIRLAEQLEDPRSLVWAAHIATVGGTIGDGLPSASRAVAIARERALLNILPIALWQQASALTGQGRLKLAYAAAEEGIRLASEFGHYWGSSWNLSVLATIDAMRGDEARARAHADETMELAARSGTTLLVGYAEWTLGLLELSLGRPREATDRLLQASAGEKSKPRFSLWSIVDLIEAAARSGRLDEITDRLDSYTEWVHKSPSPARLSLLARCMALVGEGDEQEQFEAALAPYPGQSPIHQGRTELLYGEWLRRERQRREARAHLRKAAELFRQVGLPPWEERAQAELRATGETARRRDPSTLDQLTPQELQITGLVASGMTNRQIAAQLYLSPRTIDYHLRKVFSKLGVASRTELAGMGLPPPESD
jgi:ATP/maltotriose-dependent transcriptional regulator MalT